MAWISIVGLSEEHAEAVQAMGGCSFSRDIKFLEDSPTSSAYSPGMLLVSLSTCCLCLLLTSQAWSCGCALDPASRYTLKQNIW